MTELKTCARRFSFQASGRISFYIACDLDEGILRYWPHSDESTRCRLLLSSNRDERLVAQRMLETERERKHCVGIQLTPSQVATMEALLDVCNIEAMRGLDDDAIAQRAGGFCYRDGWELDFYAEGDAGWPPLKLTNIISCTFDDVLPFEKLESLVLSEVLAGHRGSFAYDVSRKVPPEKENAIIERALEVGLAAIREILWRGSARLIRKLDATPIGRHLSYTLSGRDFSIFYGNEVSRSCKLYDMPACIRVFGNSHVFEE